MKNKIQTNSIVKKYNKFIKKQGFVNIEKLCKESAGNTNWMLHNVHIEQLKKEPGLVFREIRLQDFNSYSQNQFQNATKLNPGKRCLISLTNMLSSTFFGDKRKKLLQNAQVIHFIKHPGEDKKYRDIYYNPVIRDFLLFGTGRRALKQLYIPYVVDINKQRDLDQAKEKRAKSQADKKYSKLHKKYTDLLNTTSQTINENEKIKQENKLLKQNLHSRPNKKQKNFQGRYINVNQN